MREGRRILAAALLGLAGLGAAAAAAAPVAGVGVLRLSRPGRAPLVLLSLDPTGDVYAVGPAALYSGLGVNWKASERLLRLERPGAGGGGESPALARLQLGEPWLYDGDFRVALPGPLTLSAGAPALDRESLRLVLERLCVSPPLLSAPSAEEVAAEMERRGAPASSAPDVSPELSLVPTQAPVVYANPNSGGRIRTVVLDAGHGGYDPGALGPRGLKEKDVCLDIALRTKASLEALLPGVKVILTRAKDVYIDLKDRTILANDANADLFISIHNNASRNRASRGSQVFFYDSQSSDRAARDLVRRENDQVNELEVLMTDLAKSLVRDQSIAFASKVQNELGKALSLKSRNLSYAPFYVLARTKMPAILVEVAFITNPAEEQLLSSAAFRQKVADSLARGVREYGRMVAELR